LRGRTQAPPPPRNQDRIRNAPLVGEVRLRDRDFAGGVKENIPQGA
jgi:hypothetical protein